MCGKRKSADSLRGGGSNGVSLLPEEKEKDVKANPSVLALLCPAAMKNVSPSHY